MLKFKAARAGSHVLTGSSCLLASVAAIALIAADGEAQAGQGNFYFFGDSATGQGNWSAIVGEHGEDHWPYSSNNGYARESNGLIWAEMMGREVDIVLDPTRTASSLNFAISGAHMTRGGDLLPFGVQTGVQVQTDLFGAMVAAEELDIHRDDVAFMLAGGNDFLDRLDQGDNALDILQDVANAAAYNVRNLAEAGVKTIILSEMQPIQYAPEFAGQSALQADLAALVEATNQAMLAAIAAQGLPDDVNLVTMKYSALLAHMTGHADALGFSNTVSGCYDDEAETICATDVEGQNSYLFFDDLHFTERAHRLEAQWWTATLNGANGEAARQVSRLPNAAQYVLENIQQDVVARQGQAPEQGYVLFSDVQHVDAELEGLGHDIRTDVRSTGGSFGAEARLNETYLGGVAISYGEGQGDFADQSGFDLKTRALHAWVGAQFGTMTYALTGVYGWTDLDQIQRQTGVDLVTAQGQTDGRYWDVSLSASRTYERLGFSLRSRAAVHVSELEVDGFVETGATGLALEYADQTQRSERLEGLLEGRGPSWQWGDATRLTPVVDARWRYELGDRRHGLDARLIDNTADWARIETGGAARNRADLSAGFDLDLAPNWSVSGRYHHTFADDLSDADRVTLGARFTF